MKSKVGTTLKTRALKTLRSETQALRSLSGSLPKLVEAAELISGRRGDIILTGIGKSGYIAQKISSTLTSLGVRSMYLHPVEAAHGDIGALSADDVLIALSFSGTSKEVVKIVGYARTNFGIPIVSITGGRLSALAKISDIVIPLKIREEGSPGNLAPMASTTAMLALGDMLASMLAGDGVKNDFARFHPGGSLGLELTPVSRIMKIGKALPQVIDTASAKVALAEMSRKSLGVTAVVDRKGRLVGVITDGDVRRWIISGGDARRDAASVLMTKRPKTILESQSLKEALRILEDHRITTLFVIDPKGRPKGVVHIHDIIESNIV